MCEITHREAIRLSIKDKLNILQKKEPVLAELFQQLLDLDEEAQKPPIMMINPYQPSTTHPPYRIGDWYWGGPTWWDASPKYRLTITNDTLNGHYSLEADATT